MKRSVRTASNRRAVAKAVEPGLARATIVTLGGVYIFVISTLLLPYLGSMAATGTRVFGALLASAAGLLLLASRPMKEWFRSAEIKNFAILLAAIVILLVFSSVQAIIYNSKQLMPALSRSVMAGTILCAGAYLLLEMRPPEARKAFWVAILLMPAFCVAAAMMFLLLSPVFGAPPTEVVAYSYLARVIGLPSLRQSFLGGGGLTYTASLAAFSIGVLLIGIWNIRREKWFTRWLLMPCSIVVCLFVLVLSDGRTAMGALAVALLCATYGRKFILCHPLLAITILIVLLPAGMYLVSLLPSKSVVFLSRGRTGSDVTDNPRFFIWGTYFKDLFAFNPGLIFGYGQFGQMNSGLSSKYVMIFSGWQQDPTSFSLHSMALQILVEMGLLGLAAIVTPIYFILVRAKHLTASNPVEVVVVVYLIVFTLLSGGTDTIGSPLMLEYFVYFWIVGLAFMRLPKAGSILRRPASHMLGATGPSGTREAPHKALGRHARTHHWSANLRNETRASAQSSPEPRGAYPTFSEDRLRMDTQ